MLSILLLVVFTALFVEAQVRSPNFQYNVTSPAPNSPYVASQILPLIYDVASNATSENLKLSVSLLGTNTSVQIVASADISQGFSFQKQIGGATVYEHQYNYNIPFNTTAGIYQVVFLDSASKTNVSIPITISAAPVTPTSSSLPSGSVSSVPTTSSPASVFINSASPSLKSSTPLLVFCFITTYLYL